VCVCVCVGVGVGGVGVVVGRWGGGERGVAVSMPQLQPFVQEGWNHSSPKQLSEHAEAER
jgi:hypothetical protein